jgi:hypothetical protein
MHRPHIHDVVDVAGVAARVGSWRPEAMSGLLKRKRPRPIAKGFSGHFLGVVNRLFRIV